MSPQPALIEASPGHRDSSSRRGSWGQVGWRLEVSSDVEGVMETGD